MGLHVVIPVAGVGTRLRPHTHARPKVLLPVAGKPMLGHILDEFRSYDVEEVTLVVGHKGDAVREYVTGAFPFRFRFIEQKEPRGLGHAIWVTKEAYGDLDGPLLIILGDTIFAADFDALLGAKENLIGVKEVDDPRHFGVVVLEDGRITSMVEKPPDPPTNLAIVGIYAIQDAPLLYRCLDEIVETNTTTRGEIQLTDALQKMIDQGAVMKPFEIEEWYDCGKPETLLETNRRLLDRRAERGTLPAPAKFPRCVINPPVAIDEGVVIENSIVGPYVTLGEGSIVRDSLIEDSIVSTNAEVTHCVLRGSIVADNAKVAGPTLRLNVGDDSDIQIG